MTDYENNSDKARQRPEEKKDLAKKFKGEVSINKKKRSSFFDVDFSDAASSIMKDVIIPYAKKIAMDAMRITLYGDSDSEYDDDSIKNRSRVSYTSFSDPERNSHRNRRSRGRSATTFPYDDLTFTSRADAQIVLNQMFDILDNYESVNIRELCEILGCPEEATITDERYGWLDLENAYVTANRSGFRLRLPKPVII